MSKPAAPHLPSADFLSHFLRHQGADLLPEQLRRMKVLAGVSLGLTLICFLSIILTRLFLAGKGPFPNFGECLALLWAALFGLVLVIMRTSGSLEWASRLFFLALTLTLMVSIIFDGGLGSPAFFGVVLLPFASVFFMGLPSAILLSLSSCLAATIVLYLTGTSWIPPYQPYTMTSFYHSFMLTAMVLLGLGSAWLYERERRLKLALIERQHQDNLKLALQHEAAQRANEAKDLFLANISHELRTPLNAIVGYATLLEETFEESPADGLAYVEDVRKIQSSGQHLLQIIHDMLDLSKMEMGIAPLQIVEVQLHDLEEEIEAMFAGLPQENGNRFSLENKLIRESLWSDHRHLRQVLFHLLSNANKFTKQGEVTVTIDELASGFVSFSVADTGIGIDEKDLDAVFSKFFQVDASFTRKYGGAGLGLALSKFICEMMGGGLEVTSVPGEGSTFVASFPVGVPAIDSPQLLQ